MKSMEHIYRERIKHFEDLKRILNKKLILTGFIRLVFFISIPVFLVLFKELNSIPKIGLTSLIIVGFGIAVKRFLILKNRIEHISNLILINKNELDAVRFQFKQFDDGEKYKDPEHPFTFDLDIFGEGSLFQMLNRTTTYFGSDQLAEILRNPLTGQKDIESKQKAVEELSKMLDATHNYQATGMQIIETEDDINYLYRWLSSGNFFYGRKVFRIIRWLLPSLTILFLALSIISFQLFQVFILLALSQFFIVGLFLKRINAEHGLLAKRVSVIRKYAGLIELIEKEKFEGDYLNQLKRKLSSGNIPAYLSLKQLSRLTAAFDNRLNILAAVFLEGILLWDIQCMIRLERWKAANGEEIHKWFKVLGEFESILSMASFKRNNLTYVFPVFTKNEPLKATDIGHPFLTPNERVCNDFEISAKNRFCIITGANMAGKSTFLRTVGLNMVLAMAGGVVCASAFRFIPQKLFSSMRTTDSLQKNESYFYAELIRLKRMLEGLKKGEVSFILLDEILKGTNSRDKQEGSKQVLEKIIALGGTGIIATHDLALTGTAAMYPENIVNKCFEIEIENAEIYFDYKLKEGVTKKMNAMLLLKQMGIVND